MRTKSIQTGAKVLGLIGLMFTMSCSSEPKNEEVKSEDDIIYEKVDSIIAGMTVEQKVGQMTQVTLNVICKTPEDNPGNLYHTLPAEIDEEKLAKAVNKYGVGSILNTGTYTLPREKWYELITRIQEVACNNNAKIPVIYGVDAIHGANYTVGATLFPQEIGLAATWEPSYGEQLGSVTAYDVRASAISWNFSPVLDLARQPLWSRYFETLGEDPFLASKFARAIIKGYQGDDASGPKKVAACLKHYVGYSNARSGKDRTPIIMPERMLRQYYLPAFEAAIDEGALTVMVNSSEINGTPVHANYHILTEILKEELEFKGFAVTDWQDIIFLNTIHKVAPTMRDAVKMAIDAGIDMSMVPENFEFADTLIALVKDGEVEMSRIDDAVRRILYVKFKSGLFDKPYYPMDYYKDFGSDKHAQMSYNAASESITLVKNSENVLPLDKEKKVLITGPGANSLNALNGAWTHTWQGVDPQYNTKGKLTVKEALEAKLGEGNVKYVEGATYLKEVDINNAASVAKSVDYVVVCTGEMPSTEVPGNIDDLTLPVAQKNLIAAVAEAGKPVIMVMSQSRPRIVAEEVEIVDGVLLAYFSGDEGGRAIADILYGDVNPSGKLPFTYPRATGDIVHYDHKRSEMKHADFSMNAFRPQWNFGHGLSYTTFETSDLTISTDSLKGEDTLTVSVTVTNTGDREGKEVVQVYLSDEYASITPNNKRLKGFKKVNLKVGENKTLSFSITADDLAFVNNDLEWVAEDGSFIVTVGKETKKFWFTN